MQSVLCRMQEGRCLCNASECIPDLLGGGSGSSGGTALEHLLHNLLLLNEERTNNPVGKVRIAQSDGPQTAKWQLGSVQDLSLIEGAGESHDHLCLMLIATTTQHKG